MYSYLLEELSKAIGARLIIEFSYNGNPIVVEPHLLGKNSIEQDCLSAWQLNTPLHMDLEDADNNWRSFLLCEIKELKMRDECFCKLRPGYDPYDNSMTRIYYRV